MIRSSFSPGPFGGLPRFFGCSMRHIVMPPKMLDDQFMVALELTQQMEHPMNTPEADDLRFAAEWLRQYDDEHDGGEQTAIAAKVAEWLDAQADAKELRATAREHGLPTAKLRAKLRDVMRVRGDVEIPGVGEQQAG